MRDGRRRMSRRYVPLIALLIGCGPAEPEINIDVTMSPVIAMNAFRADVALYPAATPLASCSVIRLSERQNEPKRAAYVQRILLASGDRTVDFFDLVEGSY